MFSQLETMILTAAQSIYDTWGWFGVAALLVFENATGITPSEIILGLAGWMLIAQHDLSPSMILLGGLFAALGSVAGASMAYWAARLGGRPFVDQLARWVRIDQAHIDSTERHFQHWGVKVVFFGRVIPGLRTLVSIPAGLARMNYLKFFIATFSGAYLWCTLLIGVGYILGHEWHLISEYIKLAFPYLAAAAVLALAVYFMQTRNLFALAWAKIRKND